MIGEKPIRKANPRRVAPAPAPSQARAAAPRTKTKTKRPPTAPAPPSAELRRRARQINQRLTQAYPDARCSLDFRSPLELLIATILSAQCTDERVNLTTPELFRRFPTAEDYAQATLDEITTLIRSTGFFNNKAKSIQGAARRIADTYGGQVPSTMEELLTLPGVARKTANVVMGNAFDQASGVVVDTHVQRITHLLGLTTERDPQKIERDLMALLPATEWVGFSHRLIQHGRRICIARRPRCAECVVASLCPSAEIPVERATRSTGSKRSTGKTAATGAPRAPRPTRPRPTPATGARPRRRPGS